MMLFQDGSTHEWLADQPQLDLIVTLDDATSEIYSAFLVEEEGTASSFRGLARGDRGQRAVLLALHRSGQPLLPDTQGRRQGRPGAPTQVGGRWPSSGSSTSRPTARKHAVAWNGCSAG